MTDRLSESGPKGVEPKPRKQPNEEEKTEREEGMDKTLADSFPASDPPSSIPDPEDEESAA